MKLENKHQKHNLWHLSSGGKGPDLERVKGPNTLTRKGTGIVGLSGSDTAGGGHPRGCRCWLQAG